MYTHTDDAAAAATARNLTAGHAVVIKAAASATASVGRTVADRTIHLCAIAAATCATGSGVRTVSAVVITAATAATGIEFAGGFAKLPCSCALAFSASAAPAGTICTICTTGSAIYTAGTIRITTATAAGTAITTCSNILWFRVLAPINGSEKTVVARNGRSAAVSTAAASSASTASTDLDVVRALIQQHVQNRLCVAATAATVCVCGAHYATTAAANKKQVRVHVLLDGQHAGRQKLYNVILCAADVLPGILEINIRCYTTPPPQFATYR